MRCQSIEVYNAMPLVIQLGYIRPGLLATTPGSDVQMKSDDIQIREDRLSNRSSLADLVYNEIKESLRRGRPQPGARVNLEDLAQEFQVSPRTVREALTQLVSEGLVRRDPYKAFYANELTPSDIQDILNMLRILEGWAAMEAAKRIDEPSLERMSSLLSAIDELDDPDQFSERRALHHEFHFIAIHASEKPYLIRTLESIWNWTLPYDFTTTSPDTRKRERAFDRRSHREYVKMLKAHDGDGARSVIEEHMQTSANFLLYGTESDEARP